MSTTNNNKNGIAQELFATICAEFNLTPREQSGFIRYDGKDGRVYVAKTKTVYRVDISDCSPPEHDAIKQLSADEAKLLRLGKVRGQLDFSKSPDDILFAFRLVLEKVTGQESSNLPVATDGTTVEEPSEEVEDESPLLADSEDSDEDDGFTDEEIALRTLLGIGDMPAYLKSKVLVRQDSVATADEE